MQIIYDIWEFINTQLTTIIITILDIYIVALIVYFVLRIFKNNTKAIQILKGVVLIYILYILSNLLDLRTTQWIVDYIIQWGILLVIIIFQPEIRNGLERIGRHTRTSKRTDESARTEQDVINVVSETCEYLSKRHIGALITIERNDSLAQYIDKAIKLDSALNSEVLITVFVPGTPLHDGAVIIRDKKIACAGAYYPVSENPNLMKSLGTRHRAAVGISEKYDALTVVVSEETGNISIAVDGELVQNLNKDSLELLLEKYILED